VTAEVIKLGVLHQRDASPHPPGGERKRERDVSVVGGGGAKDPGDAHPSALGLGGHLPAP